MGGAPRPRRRPRARRRSALQHGDHARGGLSPARPRRSAADLGHLRSLLRHRRQGRHASRRPARTCGGHGRIRHAQGFFTLERTCPSLPGPRPGDRATRARPAPAPAASRASARCRSTSRPASRTARASGSPAKARPACAAVRPATSTFSCRSARTRSSSATAPTCIAGCRSRWWRRRSAANSRCRPSTAARRG